MAKIVYLMDNNDLISEEDATIEFNEDGSCYYMIKFMGCYSSKKKSFIKKELSVDYTYSFTKGKMFKRDVIVKWTGRSSGLGYGEFIDSKNNYYSLAFDRVRRVK